MTDRLQIGELAKQTGLSIRTLRYYDEIGLLVPSHRTRADYRLYGEADIVRLQQILSLRQLGFTLKEIQACLDNPDYSLLKVIDLHLVRLQEQMAMSSALLTKLGTISQTLRTNQTVAIEDLIHTMETMTMTQQYLTQEQHDLLEARLNKGQADWQHLLEQARSHRTESRDLNDPEVQQMAWRWRASILSFVGGDLKLYEALSQIFQNRGAAAASWGTLDADTLDYILKAVALLSVREELSGREKLLEALTPEAIYAIEQGQLAMRQLQLNFLGTEGLLLGLLSDVNSPVTSLLHEQHIDANLAETFFRDWLADYAVSRDEIPDEIPFTPRAYRVLELAADQARQLEHDKITPIHLLLGLLKEGETDGGMAIHLLRERGVDCKSLYSRARSAIA